MVSPSGRQLSRVLYENVVAPTMRRRFPAVAFAAALLGPGSEVLGYDDARSRDHDWGPRLQVFLPVATDAAGVTRALLGALPATVLGVPTVIPGTGGSPRHRIDVTGRSDWFAAVLGFDPLLGVSTLDWLSTPTQTLASCTAGAIFYDATGEVQATCRAVHWYPDDLWRHVLACQWQRIDQDAAIAGRCAEVGDDLGAAVVVARLVQGLMRLLLLQGRRYPPYAKWLGTAFARLPGIGPVAAALTRAVAAGTWAGREDALVTAYELAAVAQNRLDLCAPVDPGVRGFHNRPFRVPPAAEFAESLRVAIGDPAVRGLPVGGAVDQWIDNTDVLLDLAARRTAVAAVLSLDPADQLRPQT